MKRCPSTQFVPAIALLACGCAASGRGPSRAMVDTAGQPHFTLHARLAAGDYEHDTSGSNLDGDTSAGVVGFLFEGHSYSGIGGGVSIEVLGSDDDLFEDEGFNAAQAGWVEVAPFFSYRVLGIDRFRMPLRVGPWFHFLELDEEDTSDSISWGSFGFRLAAEPEVVLAQAPNFECSLFTSLSLAAGGTVIDLESSTVDDEFDSESAAFGFEFGPRIRAGAFSAGVSLFYRILTVDESDPEGGVVVREIESSFGGVAFTLGARF